MGTTSPQWRARSPQWGEDRRDGPSASHPLRRESSLPALRDLSHL